MEKREAGKERRDLSDERIVSERLLLEPISLEYKEDIFKEFTAEITTYMYPAPAKEVSEVEGFIKASLDKSKEGSNLQFIVLEKKSKEFLGCAGLHHVDRLTPEMGIWLKKDAHGKAYGREAMTAIKEWADKNLDYEYILYPVAEDNIASRKIPESMGGLIEYEYQETGLGGNRFYCLEYRIYPEADKS